MVSSKTTRRLALGAVLVLVLVLAVPVAADEAVGPVYPWTGEWQEFTVEVGDTVLLGARWGACTRGLAAIGRHVSFDYFLNGSPVPTDLVWSRPYAIPRAPEAPCIAKPNSDVAWRVTAESPLVLEQPGDYELTVVISARHPIVDGADYDGDGKPDQYLREPLTFTSTVHVIGP